MSLSVVTMILNEQTFLPLFLESVAAYATQLVIFDGGSRDHSVEIVRNFRAPGIDVDLIEMPQQGRPYVHWDEGNRRNLALQRARCEWILMLDADEIMDDRFAEEAPALLADPRAQVYGFQFVNFWRDPHTVRMNAPNDPNWEFMRAILWRNGLGIRYDGSHGMHPLPELNGNPLWNCSYKRTDIRLYHYHYALGPRVKEGDLRSADLGNAGDGAPDFAFRPDRYEIVTAPFRGKHPAAVRRFLESQPRQFT